MRARVPSCGDAPLCDDRLLGEPYGLHGGGGPQLRDALLRANGDHASCCVSLMSKDLMIDRYLLYAYSLYQENVLASLPSVSKPP